MTVYQSSGNTTTASPVMISLLDGQAFYQTQLSTIVSSSSWVVYQLLAGLLISVIYLVTRPQTMNQVDGAYAHKLESYRLERSLVHLDELLKSGKMSQKTYDQLKLSYEGELARAREVDKTT
jgi:hypothetical protein